MFALLLIPYYPSSLNLLYNSQSYFNFNFVTLPYLPFIDCNQLAIDEDLNGNYNQHPSITNINFICNSFSIISSFVNLLLLYLFSWVLHLRIFKILKKSFEWNTFLQFFGGILIPIIVICLTQINLY